MSIEISCLCGDIKLSLEGDPLGQFYCHCDDCQAVHGAAYIGIALYLHEAIKLVHGLPVSWVYKTNPRSRCAKCGTILFEAPQGVPFKGVTATLLPKGIFKPTFHMQCQHAVLPVVDKLPHFKGFPSKDRSSDETMDW